MLEAREAKERKDLDEKTKALGSALQRLRDVRHRGDKERPPEESSAFETVSSLAADRQRHVKALGSMGHDDVRFAPRTEMIPPTIVSDLEARKLVSDKFLEEEAAKRHNRN